MRRFMVMLVAVVLGASLMAPAVAAVGPRGDAVVRTTAAQDVPLYKCYTLDKTTAQLKAMPPGVAWLYLVALGWKGTLEEFFALSFWDRCQFYLAAIPPATPR